MDVMGGCCGQTFLAVSPDERKKLFWGPETLGGPWDTGAGSTSRRLQAQYIILFTICPKAVKAVGLSAYHGCRIHPRIRQM